MSSSDKNPFVKFDLITNNFKKELETVLKNNTLTGINIVVAFITPSGSRQLVEWVNHYHLAHIPIKIVTGTYTDFTHPDALSLLLGEPTVSLRVIDSQEENLHAKAFLLELAQNQGIIFVGSSNLTAFALNKNIEWNAKISSFQYPDYYAEIKKNFDYLWSIAQDIDTNWINAYRTRYKYSNAFDREREERDLRAEVPHPRYAQIDALQALEQTRRLDHDRALIVLATGLGKTHLAAFDSLNYRKVLFIAHVEEILFQAEQIFKQVRKFGTTGQLADGWHTRTESDVLFTTVQKLSREKNLQQFRPDEFDYIVIDEFHHAQAQSYKKIITYFTPLFLLGLTATPFRMDRKDISELCDGNIPYICNMPEAIENHWLSPFTYYGVFDETVDYSTIPWTTTTGYAEKDLQVELNKEERARQILEQYHKYSAEPTVGFCAGIEHADYMATYFNEHGIPAVAVHSGAGALSPTLAKDKVVSGQVKVIFAVNVFNEGVDLPEIRKVMLLRPTESITVFIQQIGRGLRKTDKKERLLILDFIGNYKKAYMVPALLMGKINPHIGKELYKEILEDVKKRYLDHEYMAKYTFPAGCEINFELKVIDDMLERIGIIDPVRQGYIQRYQKIKTLLGRRPSLRDMLEQGEYVMNYLVAFKSWLQFYKEVGDISEKEQGYHKTEVKMLAWLERRPLETFLSLEIVAYCYKHANLTISLEEIAKYFEHWVTVEEERTEWLNQEKRRIRTDSENVALTEVIVALMTLKYQNIGSGWLVQGTFLEKDPEISWETLKDEIDERLMVRKKEYQALSEQLYHGALYTKKELKEYFRSQGATENIDHYFGDRSPGIIRMDSIKILVMFVTLEKTDEFQELQQAYNDEIVSETRMRWESQNVTTTNSPNGRVITGQEPTYTKLMFVRLRRKDTYYGVAFFYLGEVTVVEYEGEKPIKVLWQFVKKIPAPIYEYLTNKDYRKIEAAVSEFVTEEI